MQSKAKSGHPGRSKKQEPSQAIGDLAMAREHVRFTNSGPKEKQEVEWDIAPNECPLCHSTIVAEHALGYLRKTNEDEDLLQVVYHCPRRGCERFFIASYRSSGERNRSPRLFLLQGTAPMVPIAEKFGESIEKLSAEFVNIYNQALAAETAGLDQIAGVGMRKALEFLVKDFAVKLNPKGAEAIRAKTLAMVISDHINDARVQTCAKLATWLGNDEAHYVRKWVDKDIADLKRLTKLTVLFAESVLLAEQYEKEMAPQAGQTK